MRRFLQLLEVMGLVNRDETLIGNTHDSYHYNLEITSILNHTLYQHYWTSVYRPLGDDETDLMILFEKDRMLDESKNDPYDPYNLEMTSNLNPISCQCYWSDFEKKKSDGIDTRTPFEGGKALDDRTFEDESESDEIYGKTLVGNTQDQTYNLFPLNPWMSEYKSDGICDETLADSAHDPCNLEITSVLNHQI